LRRSLTNAERDNDGDSNYAWFKNLDEEHQGNGWTDFDNVRSRNNSYDPDYIFVRVSADEHRVKMP
jgi:hypothetical protein